VTTALLPDLYATLGVPRDASEMDIRGAYGRAVLAGRDAPRGHASRELLDLALSTLTDPELRARYDAQAPIAAAQTDAVAQESDFASAAFGHARNGALWFAGGGLITAISYASAAGGGKFFIAWGAVLFGAFQMIRGLAMYMRVPAIARTRGQMATLGVLAACGVLSSGWVIANESGVIQDPTVAAWNASIDKADPIANKAADLFQQVSDRPGTWSAQDSADMRQASVLYGQVADIFAASPVDPSLVWYRDGLMRNYREAAAITSGFAGLTAQSRQAEIDVLGQRWDARITELIALTDRVKKQTGAAP
jgi:hypothetical protein